MTGTFAQLICGSIVPARETPGNSGTTPPGSQSPFTPPPLTPTPPLPSRSLAVSHPKAACWYLPDVQAAILGPFVQEHECIFAGLARGYCGQGTSVGRSKAQIPVRRSLDRPTTFVDQVVVVRAQQRKVVQAGFAPVVSRKASPSWRRRFADTRLQISSATPGPVRGWRRHYAVLQYGAGGHHESMKASGIWRPFFLLVVRKAAP
jgi:hypothetical protein